MYDRHFRIFSSSQDIFHERAWIKSDIYAVAIKCVVETRDTAHALELKQELFARYENVIWGARGAPQPVTAIDNGGDRRSK